MNDTPVLTFSGRAIEDRIVEQVLATVGGPDALKGVIRPIVRDLIAEELPRALQKAMPDILREIDSALAASIGKAT